MSSFCCLIIVISIPNVCVRPSYLIMLFILIRWSMIALSIRPVSLLITDSCIVALPVALCLDHGVLYLGQHALVLVNDQF